MASTHDATVIRCKLDELRALDPAAAAEVEAVWPITLRNLDVPGSMRILTTTAEVLRAQLEEELDHALAERKLDATGR